MNGPYFDKRAISNVPSNILQFPYKDNL